MADIANGTRAKILSTVHALAAAYRALQDHLQGRQRSKNVHSEIVYSLNPNNNVSTVIIVIIPEG